MHRWQGWRFGTCSLHRDQRREDAGRLHAAQLWIALPETERQRPPNFQHYPDLPVLEAGGFRVTVLAIRDGPTRASRDSQNFTSEQNGGNDCSLSWLP